jgi:hypothetical protein
MNNQTLEQRVARLEAEVRDLRQELRANGDRRKDWRRTVGAFTDDAGVQEIFREAMKLREGTAVKLAGSRPGPTEQSMILIDTDHLSILSDRRDRRDARHFATDFSTSCGCGRDCDSVVSVEERNFAQLTSLTPAG